MKKKKRFRETKIKHKREKNTAKCYASNVFYCVFHHEGVQIHVFESQL